MPTRKKNRIVRFPASGWGVATPCGNEAELNRVLSTLNVSHSIDETAAREIYVELGVIINKWLMELGRVRISPIADKLLSMANNLNEISQLMSGLETGIRDRFETAVASQVAKFLALHPAVGSSSKAHELMTSFHRDAALFGHICFIAYWNLRDVSGKQGRLALDWYDDFTALLLKIAARSGIKPTLRKDRLSGLRSGWLFDAAQAFETFLYPPMCSPSAEACGKRLERGRKRLQDLARQKPRAR